MAKNTWDGEESNYHDKEGNKFHKIKFTGRDYEFVHLHNERGPAVVGKNGYKAYYNVGMLGRENGPAITLPDGTQQYWDRNVPHRKNGPAVIYPDGKVEYWLEGVQYSKEQWEVEKEKCVY